MKLSVEWLREFVETPLSNEALAEKLTMAGLEVEEISETDGGTVYDTKATPNRGDWLSVVGSAREAAAALDLPLKWRAPVLPDEDQDVCRWAGVLVTNPSLCPRYAGKVIRNVKHGPSPDWMQNRLMAAGMRPIDVVVDITNYVMLELGQPLHAFDYDTLPEGRVIVRPARAGEVIVTLDGIERRLPDGALAICSIDKPVCIAGIMGNAETEVTESTRHVFLESAHFSALSVRRTAKFLGLTTEASYRFERTVDPNLVPIALERAADLLADLAGGEVVLGRIDLYPSPVAPRVVPIRTERANAILGTDLSHDGVARALVRLGLQVDPTSDPFMVTVPTFRPDLVAEIDLIEEVGRMVGYDALPMSVPRASGTGAGDDPAGALASRLRATLTGMGMRDAQTHVLVAPSPFDDPALLARRVPIRQAMSAELSGLRVSLVPNLLQVTALNLRQRQTDIRIFEVGKVFRIGAEGETKYVEHRSVAGALTGSEMPRGWSEGDVRPVTFYTVKGIVETLLSQVGAPAADYVQAAIHGMHPGRGAWVDVAGQRLGFVAEVDPDAVKRDLDVPASVGRMGVFELNADALLSVATDERRYALLPRYPAVSRDLAVVVDTGVAYGALERAARSAADPALLDDISVQSVYTGERVAPGKKSVAVRITFRASNRTLTDPEVDAQLAAIEFALVDQLAATKR